MDASAGRREGTTKGEIKGRGRMKDGSQFSFALRVIEMAFMFCCVAVPTV